MSTARRPLNRQRASSITQALECVVLANPCLCVHQLTSIACDQCHSVEQCSNGRCVSSNFLCLLDGLAILTCLTAFSQRDAGPIPPRLPLQPRLQPRPPTQRLLHVLRTSSSPRRLCSCREAAQATCKRKGQGGRGGREGEGEGREGQERGCWKGDTV